MRAYEKVDLVLHSFVPLALDEAEWPASLGRPLATDKMAFLTAE
jgi:hypothetical protein